MGDRLIKLYWDVRLAWVCMSTARKYLLLFVILVAGLLGFFHSDVACVSWLSGVAFMDTIVPFVIRRSRFAVRDDD